MCVAAKCLLLQNAQSNLLLSDMNYQAICAAIEVPVNAAVSQIQPAIKIYFDNIIAIPPDATGEYVMVKIMFGLVTESTLSEMLNRARGSLIIRIFTQKNAGARRARKISEAIVSALCQLGESQKNASGVFLRVRDIAGPAFFMDQEQPHFMAQIEASWDATNLG